MKKNVSTLYCQASLLRQLPFKVWDGAAVNVNDRGTFGADKMIMLCQIMVKADNVVKPVEPADNAVCGQLV